MRVARAQEIDQVAPFQFYDTMPRMSALKLVLWRFLAVLGSVALAFRFYGRWISLRIVELNDQRVTPAVRLKDGVEY